MTISEQAIRNAVSEIRPVQRRILTDPDEEITFTLNAKEEVVSRYQPIFLPENVGSITEEEFKSFLLYRNNHHWKGFQRLGGYVTQDMDLLREALTILVNEELPIEVRLEQLLPKKGPMVPGLGRAVLTAILLVTYPDRFGALNKITEGGLRLVGIWPQFERGASFAQRYVEVNEILLRLASSLECDLWTLDAIWWHVSIAREQDKIVDDGAGEASIAVDVELNQRFGLEKYLQQFLYDNWDSIPQLCDWSLYEEDGDIVGFEYNTGEIGRIDLLARHKTDPKWLVVELKRNQGTDQTMGQVQRYMGWVSENLASSGDEVQGLIICQTFDQGLRYALGMTRYIDLMEYEVDFRLRVPENT